MSLYLPLFYLLNLVSQSYCYGKFQRRTHDFLINGKSNSRDDFKNWRLNFQPPFDRLGVELWKRAQSQCVEKNNRYGVYIYIYINTMYVFIHMSKDQPETVWMQPKKYQQISSQAGYPPAVQNIRVKADLPFPSLSIMELMELPSRSGSWFSTWDCLTSEGSFGFHVGYVVLLIIKSIDFNPNILLLNCKRSCQQPHVPIRQCSMTLDDLFTFGLKWP